MKRIRRGITRTVILTRRHAIKFPSLRPYHEGLRGLLWSVCRGILANQSEADWWRHSPVEQKQFLCPVRHSWLGGIINIYPRCYPFEVDRKVEQAMFERTYRPLPGLHPRPSDNKPDNYGWLGSQLVMLDYDMNYNGCPHDRSGFRNRLEEDLDED